MNLPLMIAGRYLFSRKSTNAINIISGVSMAGMAIGSMALILVLSVFNGFEGLVISLYNLFYPEIKVTAIEGKVFTLPDEQMVQLQNIDGVLSVSEVLEEKALLRYKEAEHLATLKGVDENYAAVTGIDSAIYRGVYRLKEGEYNFAVIGLGIEAILGVNIDNALTPITVYVPKRGVEVGLDPSSAFSRKAIYPAGVFEIQQEFDSEYIVVPIEFMRDVLNYKNEMSALEISIKEGVWVGDVQEEIKMILRSGFHVENRYEQNRFLYKVMQTEKWAVYAILTLILLIAAFNIIGSLSMLVIDKSKDIAILKTMGASDRLVKHIFLLEGMLLSLVGSGAGILLALSIALAQIYFGFIPINSSGTFVINEYPVELRLEDFILVISTVILISLLASYLPARRAASQRWLIKEE